MNINSINVGLTGENLLSIYNDFVSIKEIDIKKVEINDDIKIIGSFSKGVIIKFEVKVKFNSMENGLTKGWNTFICKESGIEIYIKVIKR